MVFFVASIHATSYPRCVERKVVSSKPEGMLPTGMFKIRSLTGIVDVDGVKYAAGPTPD